MLTLQTHYCSSPRQLSVCSSQSSALTNRETITLYVSEKWDTKEQHDFAPICKAKKGRAESTVPLSVNNTSRECGNTGKSCKEGRKTDLGLMNVFMMWMLRYSGYQNGD